MVVISMSPFVESEVHSVADIGRSERPVIVTGPYLCNRWTVFKYGYYLFIFQVYQTFARDLYSGQNIVLTCRVQDPGP